jgi:hypothetical protein
MINGRHGVTVMIEYDGRERSFLRNSGDDEVADRMPHGMRRDPHSEDRLGEVAEAFRKLRSLDRPSTLADKQPGLARSRDGCAMITQVATDRVDQRLAEGATIDITFLGVRGIDEETFKVIQKAAVDLDFGAACYPDRRFGKQDHCQGGPRFRVRRNQFPPIAGRRMDGVGLVQKLLPGSPQFGRVDGTRCVSRSMVLGQFLQAIPRCFQPGPRPIRPDGVGKANETLHIDGNSAEASLAALDAVLIHLKLGADTPGCDIDGTAASAAKVEMQCRGLKPSFDRAR